MADKTAHNGMGAEDTFERYLQGELTLSEMEALERAAATLPDEAASIIAYSKLLDTVATGLDDVAPTLDPSMRDRVLSIADAKPISQVVRANGGQWVESGVAGIQFKKLFEDADTKKMTVLARIAAGARMPAHRHDGLEECLVIEGSLWTDGVLLHAGDYIVTQDQTVHEDTWSADGAVVLLKTYMSDEILAS
jgi:anti-sigma factor ChrR (cupin superfamily)